MVLTRSQKDKQRRVIKKENCWDIYKFARDNTGADVAALQQVLIQQMATKECDPHIPCMFARDIPGADVTALQQCVIEMGSGYAAYLFSLNIPSANVVALQQTVIEKGDGWDCYMFSRDVPGADVTLLFASAESKAFDELNAEEIKAFRILRDRLRPNIGAETA